MSIQKRLSAGEFVVIAEMTTPKGVDVSRLVTDARRIQGRVDAVSIPDMDSGVMRLSALAGGVLMREQGLEPMLHIYCRDRNRLALQGDLLAAHVLGLKNLLVVRGEDMAQGDHREAKPVDDLDEAGLLGAIGALQEGKDLAGFELDGAPTFFPGAAVDGRGKGRSSDQVLDEASRLVEAGARFLVTCPVFDVAKSEGWLKQLSGLGVPVIATVFLIKSVAVARYIATHEPEAGVSEELIGRLRKSKDRQREGIRVAGETIQSLRSHVQGCLIQTLGWESRLPALLDEAKL